MSGCQVLSVASLSRRRERRGFPSAAGPCLVRAASWWMTACETAMVGFAVMTLVKGFGCLALVGSGLSLSIGFCSFGVVFEVALVERAARRVWLVAIVAVLSFALSFGSFGGRRVKAFAMAGFDRCTFVSVNFKAAKATEFKRVAAAY